MVIGQVADAASRRSRVYRFDPPPNPRLGQGLHPKVTSRENLIKSFIVSVKLYIITNIKSDKYEDYRKN